MPVYTMINNQTGEEEDHVLSLSGRDEFLAKGTHHQKLSTAKFISQHGSTLSKTDDGWKSLIKKVDKMSPRNNMKHK